MMFFIVFVVCRMIYLPYSAGKFFIRTSDVGSIISSMDKIKVPQNISIPIAVMFRFFPSFKEEWKNYGYALASPKTLTLLSSSFYCVKNRRYKFSLAPTKRLYRAFAPRNRINLLRQNASRPSLASHPRNYPLRRIFIAALQIILS